MIKLALGTVQFGHPYGITNINKSRMHQDEITAILSCAHHNKITTLDTAAAYGDSEKILGDILTAKSDFAFKIITKTLPIRQKNITEEQIRLFEKTFNQSLEKLQKENLYGVMIHDSTDLIADNSNIIFEKLLQIKAQKKVTKIGCSFYNPDDLFKILEKFDLDLVQIPLNLFDQRFIDSGAIEYLKKKKIEIYVRSVFLQGLLLAPTQKLDLINMSHVKIHIDKMDEICLQNQIDRISLIISFLKKMSDCYFVMGFQNTVELQEILESIEKHSGGNNIDFSTLRIDDLSVINPTLWNKK